METTRATRIPEERRRVGERPDRRSRGTRRRPGPGLASILGSGVPADAQGHQRPDPVRGSLQVRHVGAHSARRQTDARYFRADVSRGHSTSGLGRSGDAVFASLLRDDARLVPAGHRSSSAHADDPRPGRPSADVHHGRLEAPAVRHAPALHRVRGEPVVAQGQDRAGITRDDQLRRMDGRPPVHAAERVRPEGLGKMVRRRRRRGSEGRIEHADREGDGRLHPGLRHERRGGAAAERLSAAADGPRLRRHFPHQVGAAHQGGRSGTTSTTTTSDTSIRTRRKPRSATRSDRSR